MDTQIEPKEGIVIFIDALGYQSFLDNNTTQDITQEVLSFLSDLPQKITEKMEKSLSKELVSGVETLVFSDTIVVTIQFSKDKAFDWFLATTYAGMLCNHLFDFGMPVRAAIDCGLYFRHKNCLAGSAISNAYKLSSNLDLAGCVLSDTAASNLKNIKVQTDDIVGATLLNRVNLLYKIYLTPMKSGEKLLNHLIYPLRWFSTKELVSANAKPGDATPEEFDPSSIVARSFWALNKQVPASARSKLINTELLFRYFQTVSTEKCGFTPLS